MYIVKHVDLIDANEPQLGSITEPELIQDEGEGLDLLIDDMVSNQEVPTTFYAIDDYTDEDIELQTSDYLDDAQIDMLNAMFMDSCMWDEDVLRYIIENLRSK